MRIVRPFRGVELIWDRGGSWFMTLDINWLGIGLGPLTVWVKVR